MNSAGRPHAILVAGTPGLTHELPAPPPAAPMDNRMNHRRLGRTGLRVSVVGFGTCQLRLVPERVAVETLRRGFELGVNIVHTAPDYEGADELVARVVKETAPDVIVCSQGYGSMDLFEYFFESACARFGKRSLELFGIACVEDREALGENVWGAGGMVEFLLRKKREGRLRGIFCTTHGSPEYIRGLIRTNVFDALMVAYNVLGFHLLSSSPARGQQDAARGSRSSRPPAPDALGQRTTFESIARNRAEVFPLARQHDVGLMIMKPLAGGLLCAGKAFPPRAGSAPAGAPISAREALRFILASPEVSCVVPGTASPAEAEENASAGCGDIAVPVREVEQLTAKAQSFDSAVCSRCGLCDSSCSQGLPISWLFRAGYLSLYPSETFETQDELDYFRLHPSERAACGDCPSVTCHCPSGIDIKAELVRIHQAMSELAGAGLAPPPHAIQRRVRSVAGYGARIITSEIPAAVRPGALATCRLYLENIGQRPWHAGGGEGKPRTSLFVYLGGELQQVAGLRTDVHPGERGHFVFEFPAPPSNAPLGLRLDLVETRSTDLVLQAVRLLEANIMVADD
jgi:predicted aldo/keto reductase-like oxidoreductase